MWSSYFVHVQIVVGPPWKLLVLRTEPKNGGEMSHSCSVGCKVGHFWLCSYFSAIYGSKLKCNFNYYFRHVFCIIIFIDGKKFDILHQSNTLVPFSFRNGADKLRAWFVIPISIADKDSFPFIKLSHPNKIREWSVFLHYFILLSL